MSSLKNAFEDIYNVSIDVANIKNAKGNIDKIALALKGLNAEQSVYRMELAKSSEEEIISALRKNKIAEVDIQSALAKDMNTLATTANTTATKAQTVAEEDALLEQWLLISGEKAETAAVVEGTVATNADTVATVANTSAKSGELFIITLLRTAWMKLIAVIKSHPYSAAITAIVAATYGAIKASEAWSNRLKKQAQESSNAYKETLEEIESINSELQTNGQRIDELNAKENLTLVEAEELERLKESNRELENTLALKEKLAERENTKANKDAVKYFNEDTDLYNYERGTFDATHIEVATVGCKIYFTKKPPE
ncbi:MAG: hypothetical protein NC313_07555 [Butyrivibrio sp.]|nr:hypothetical protein [Butyrivibrio sp.]